MVPHLLMWKYLNSNNNNKIWYFISEISKYMQNNDINNHFNKWIHWLLYKYLHDEDF